jgi:hypothetical protein
VIKRRTGRAASARVRVAEKTMTLLTLPGEGPAFPYVGQPMHILAGHGRLPQGFRRDADHHPASLRRADPARA